MPTLAQEQMQQLDRRHAAARDKHLGAMEIGDRTLAEQHHTPHRAVAGDCKIRQQQISLRMHPVLDRADHTHIDRPVGHPRVERTWHAVDHGGINRHDATIDSAIHRIGVDIGDSSDAQHFRPPRLQARRRTSGECDKTNRAPPAASPPRVSAATAHQATSPAAFARPRRGRSSRAPPCLRCR